MKSRKVRRAAATVELAFVLPLLLFLFVAGMDYARVFQAAVIVSNCARNGALYASDSNVAFSLPYETVEEAVAADASGLTPLTVSIQEGVDLHGYGWVEVTVKYPFRTVIALTGIASQIDITRRVRMRKLPQPAGA